jgi:Sortase domain
MALMVTFPRYAAIAGDYAHLRLEPLTKKGHSVIHAGSLKHSVILGHVDSYSGTSVFYDLKTLRPGNLVKVVRADGSTAVFSVDGLQRAAKDTFPAASVYGGLSYPGLRLVTCGGPFDSATGHYLDNIIVYAHLVTAVRG